MRGYRSDPDRTAEAIDEDGWLHTGDIAEIDEDGYVRIVDRKKELIINAAGKNMSPANIEAHIKSSSSLIGQAIAIGDMRPYNVALIVLDPTAPAPGPPSTDLAIRRLRCSRRSPVSKPRLPEASRRQNSGLSRVEQIKRFAILSCDWLPGGDDEAQAQADSGEVFG